MYIQMYTQKLKRFIRSVCRVKMSHYEKSGVKTQSDAVMALVVQFYDFFSLPCSLHSEDRI
jgi:hypothetical protein